MNNFFLIFIFSILLITISPIHSQGENDVETLTQTDYIDWLLIPFGGLVAGIVTYFLKRSFVKQDVKYKTQVEHEHWLLQQFNKLSESYYFPLAKFSKDAEISIKQAVISKEEKSIQIAFYYFGIFLRKYFDFKQTTGANFLFRDQNTENKAMNQIRGFLIELPYDDLELQDMIKDTFDNDGNFKKSIFSSNFFKIFEDWLKTKFCEHSQSLAITKLNGFACSLNKGGEQTSHPKSFDNQIEKIPLMTSNNIDNFWIIGLSKKSAKPGDNLIVFGKGFNNQYVKFDFFIGNSKFEQIVKKMSNYIELQIPTNLEQGIYDVFANFKVECRHRSQECTIGIPLKIINL